MLYEILSLYPAYQASDEAALLNRLRQGKHANFAQSLRPKIHPALKAIMRKATALKPQDRYADTGALAEDLHRYLRGEALEAYQENIFERMQRWMKHNQQATLVIFVSLLLLSSAFIGGSLYQRQHAIKAAQVHEAQLYTFMNKVLKKGQALDHHLLKLEGLLSSLGTNAVDLLHYGSPHPEPALLNRTVGQNPPADFAPTPAYQSPVSFKTPVYKVVPQSISTELAQDLQKLRHLADQMRRTLVYSAVKREPALSFAAEKELIAEGKTPLVWTSIGLESGLMFTYPGTEYSADYDPRVRPWYTVAKGKYGTVWSDPYADSQGQGLLLSCSMPLYAHQDTQFLGVASVDLLLNNVAKQWLPLSVPGVQAVYLLNAEGKIVSEVQGKTPVKHKAVKRGETVDLRAFDNTELIAALKHDRGFIETPEALYIHTHIPTLDWHYVVVADPSQIFVDANVSAS